MIQAMNNSLSWIGPVKSVSPDTHTKEILQRALRGRQVRPVLAKKTTF